jgi:hypothetical protein
VTLIGVYITSCGIILNVWLASALMLASVTSCEKLG